MKITMWFSAFRRQVNKDLKEGQVRMYHVLLFLLVLLIAAFGESIFDLF